MVKKAVVRSLPPKEELKQVQEESHSSPVPSAASVTSSSCESSTSYTNTSHQDGTSSSTSTSSPNISHAFPGMDFVSHDQIEETPEDFPMQTSIPQKVAILSAASATVPSPLHTPKRTFPFGRSLRRRNSSSLLDDANTYAGGGGGGVSTAGGGSTYANGGSIVSSPILLPSSSFSSKPTMTTPPRPKHQPPKQLQVRQKRQRRKLFKISLRPTKRQGKMFEGVLELTEDHPGFEVQQVHNARLEI